MEKNNSLDFIPPTMKLKKDIYKNISTYIYSLRFPKVPSPLMAYQPELKGIFPSCSLRLVSKVIENVLQSRTGN